MKLSEVKKALKALDTIAFQLPHGELVPRHFHVTEVGKVTKHFIDCGGQVRHEEVVNFQLWSANDYDHRLHPEKLLKIIQLSEEVLGITDLEIEVEYQMQSHKQESSIAQNFNTIGKFGLAFDGTHFLLTPQQTDCLAKDQCGVPTQKKKIALAELSSTSCCTPESNCC
ncbi:DUF6428 family protein [Mesonia sp. K7]|uniref:DUF6428 family protein n=1 Tax=Mesonia sp. K7 TaxID=2218606 RepID=UPI000DA9A2E2|nr:DUF6428 family protein [Mesonia sp. K7]PZD79185.1 hypothetical protein DNG35_01470 [Mesonia sp. K7]